MVKNEQEKKYGFLQLLRPIYFLQGLSLLWKNLIKHSHKRLNYPKCYCYVQNVILSYSESIVASLGYLSPLYRICNNIGFA